MNDTPRSKRLRRGLGRLGRGARNALDLVAEGRLGGPATTPFEVAREEEICKLRRYVTQISDGAEPVLLVPPLMVYSEVYDISPELSAVRWLVSQGIDTWLIDFGAPEKQEGGLRRSLDDHVMAIDRAIDLVVDVTGRPIHLIGYSQGGLFCYQAAALRQSRGVGSIVTFGAPVDISRNFPLKVHEGLAGRLLHAAGEVAKGPLKGPLGEIPGISATLSSTSFKVLYPANELKHLARLIGVLPNRRALERELPKRRFLRGQGFVAWPGPAFRDFLEQVIMENRLASGGLVIHGRSVSLADITCPILYFYGSRDNLARPSAAKAIERVAPHAEVQGLEIDSGHFGLVVGSRALQRSWPLVVEWVRWRSGLEEMPEALGGSEAELAEEPAAGGPVVRQMYRLATDVMDGLWHDLGERSLQAAEVVDALRWQLPRLARLESLREGSRVSFGRALAEQAKAIPDETFFLWRGRAYTYAEADRRVTRTAAALFQAGVHPGAHVGVLLGNHPDHLTAVAALSRLGAVSVLLDPALRGRSLDRALGAGRVQLLITDTDHAAEARRALADSPALIFGLAHDHRVARDVVDLDAMAERVPKGLPEEIDPDSGRARDLALVLLRSGGSGLPRAVRITNRRWAIAALGMAAGCRLTPADTVLCCLPLHHGMGTLITVGGALTGGARLALVPRFSAETFWDEVRLTGSTIVPYLGHLPRALTSAPVRQNEARHPVRLFVGRGLEPEVWSRLLERFSPVEVLEFYASADGNLVLANLTGEKIGSVGRPVPPTSELALIEVAPDSGELVRDETGRLKPVEHGAPGRLISQIRRGHPLASFDGYLDQGATESRIVRDAFKRGDAWFDTGDLFRRDAEGDFWPVGSGDWGLGERGSRGNLS